MADIGADPRLVLHGHSVNEVPNWGAAEQGGLADQTGAAPPGSVAHEPWSDFGLD